VTSVPAVLDKDLPVFTISVAARLADMHPQTLRGYDRLGLVVPRRTRGGGRRYSAREIERLRLVQKLSQDEGINLAGIRHILTLKAEVESLNHQVRALQTRVEHLSRTGAPSAARLFSADSGGDIRLGAARRPRRLLAITR
jgi:MerR family transcriptional regulator/heat shock protein HspR